MTNYYCVFFCNTVCLLPNLLDCVLPKTARKPFFSYTPVHNERVRKRLLNLNLVICFSYFLFFYFLKTQLGNQKITANVMEVNASQTHRQTSAEASPLPPSPPPSMVPINRPTLPLDSGAHVTSFMLPTCDDDFWPSRFYRTLALSRFAYTYPFLAPDHVIHRTETASVMTDSAISEYSSRTVSESSTAILDELQSCHYDTTDRSETPSPTLSQMSAVSDGTTLTTTAASSHVIILPHSSSVVFNQAAKVEKS